MVVAEEEGQPLEAEVEQSPKAATKKEKVIAKRLRILLRRTSQPHLRAQELEAEVGGAVGEVEEEEKLQILNQRNLTTYLTFKMMTMYLKKARSSDPIASLTVSLRTL